MFAYLRYFSAISALVIIIAAIMVGFYFRSVAEEDLRELVERNNRALSQGFVNTLWKSSHPAFEQLYKLDMKEWPRYQEFLNFKADFFKYFEDMPVANVNIYTPRGAQIVSMDAMRDGKPAAYTKDNALFVANDDPVKQSAAFQSAREGNVVTRILPDVAFPAPNRSLVKGTLVQTLVPILSDYYVPLVGGNDNYKKSNVEAVIEVYYNITPQWRQLSIFQTVSSGGIIILFLTLISLLILLSRKAENIIAKQHETNLELAATAAAAEAENRDKSQFLANVSHELRTPLNAIIGFSEIIKNEVLGTIDNPQYQDYIRDIHTSGVHLLSLINDILDYSKAEAGKLDLELAEVDVTKIIMNSMRLVSPRAENAQVKLVENLPQVHFVLNTDAKKLKQILLNLLSNAVKFTPAGGSVTVSAWENIADKSVAVEVKDSGIGIAPKDISRAMAPFGQVDNALSRKYEGTGLGLPLTKKFVELMGGTFTIASEIEVGTTVTFTLPKQPPALPNKPAA